MPKRHAPTILREWLLKKKEASASDFYDYYTSQIEGVKLSPKYGYAYITSLFSNLSRLKLIRKARQSPNPKNSSILETYYKLNRDMLDADAWIHPHRYLYPQYYKI